jgi:hypothetical protein
MNKITKESNPNNTFTKKHTGKHILENTTKLDDILSELPLHGEITCEKDTNFWFVKLPNIWNKSSLKIVNICEQTYNDNQFRKNANILGKKWNNLVYNKDETCTIDFIKPPSTSGFHISLGKYDINDNNKPSYLKQGTKINFKIPHLEHFETFRPNPS